jgi:hypothetical protein
MKMKHGLPRTRADIEHGAIPILDIALPGDLGGDQVAAADQLRVFQLRFLQSREMLLGDDENVRRRLRIHIFERKDLLILMDLPGGNFSTNDAAEQASAGRFGHAGSPLCEPH